MVSRRPHPQLAFVPRLDVVARALRVLVLAAALKRDWCKQCWFEVAYFERFRPFLAAFARLARRAHARVRLECCETRECWRD